MSPNTSKVLSCLMLAIGSVSLEMVVPQLFES